MKKIILVSLLCISSVFGIKIASFELTPEVGAGVQRVNVNGNANNYWSAYGRVWVGALDLVVVPQVRYTQMNNAFTGDFSNTQYGISLGYTFDAVVLRATPFVGASFSQFSEYYEDTFSYNAGLRVQPSILPVALSLEYDYQNPKDRFGNRRTIEGIRLNVGISF